MKCKPALLAAIAATLSVPAFAGGISLETRVLKTQIVRLPGGGTSEKLVPAGRAVPGDPMVYVLAYRNDAAQPATNVVLDSPVPATMIYRGAGVGAEPQVSLDGRNFARLAELVVTGPGGVRRPARLSDVTHVRWHITNPIAAGAAGEVSFHAALR
ncbi:MAG: hypothetical protein ABW128_11065 [Rhizorhabdus sp.]